MYMNGYEQGDSLDDQITKIAEKIWKNKIVIYAIGTYFAICVIYKCVF